MEDEVSKIIISQGAGTAFARQAVRVDVLLQCVFAVSNDWFCGFTGSPRHCRTLIPGVTVLGLKPFISSKLASSSLDASHEYHHCKAARRSWGEQQAGLLVAFTEVQQKSSASIYPDEAACARRCSSLAHIRNTNTEKRHQASDHQEQQTGISTSHFEQFLQPISQPE